LNFPIVELDGVLGALEAILDKLIGSQANCEPMPPVRQPEKRNATTRMDAEIYNPYS
jgi:hypothetical protein